MYYISTYITSVMGLNHLNCSRYGGEPFAGCSHKFATLLGFSCLALSGPAHTTPRGVGLMAWAIRRSVFSSHA